MKSIKKVWKKRWRRFKQKSRRYVNVPVLLVAIISLAGVSTILLSMQPKKDIDASGLLDTIASVESKGNYNAYFSNAANTSVQFTQMTIAEVQAWQREFIAQGNASSAVGRYQIIDTTLSGLIRQLNLKPTDVFDEATQEKLAVALLERRGLQDYVNKSISKEQFAHNLSMEWAALPKVIGDNPEQSYYQNDGLNRAHLGVSQIFAGIDTLRKK